MNEINTPDTATLSVSALIYENGNILLENHVKCGAWTLPGGKVNEGESVDEAIVRELKEELGIDIEDYMEAFPEDNIFQCEYPVGSGNYRWFKDRCYNVFRYSGDIENLEPEKHTEIRYFDKDDIENLHTTKLLDPVLKGNKIDIIDCKTSYDDITCSGYMEDVRILRQIAKPEVYDELLEALEIEFDEIPKLHFIGGDREDIDLYKDENGMDIIDVYVYSMNLDQVSVSQYINTAISTAIVGLLIAKFPILDSTIYPRLIAQYIVYGVVDKLTEYIEKLIIKYTMKGLLEKFTNLDIEQLYKDAKEFGIDDLQSIDDIYTESKKITTASLTGSLQYRGSKKNKIAVGKIKNSTSKLMDRIKDSMEIDTSVKSTPNPTTSGKSSSESQSEDESALSESVLTSLAEGSYVINGDYVTIISEDTANDPKLRQILYKERIIKRKDILALLDRVKQDVPYIKYAYPDLDRYQGKNLFVDLYYYNEAFFKNNDWKMMKGFNLYKDLLDRLINDKRISQAGYTKRTIFIPINDWHINPSTRMWMYREDLNPISIIYELMTKNPNSLKDLFKNTKVIFFGNDKYFTMDFSDTANAKKNAVKFRNFIIKINKNEEFDAEDLDTTEDTPSKEAIKTDIMDKIEVTKGVDLTAANAKLKKKQEEEGPNKTASNKVVPPSTNKTVQTATKKSSTPKKTEEKENDSVISKATANKSDDMYDDTEEIQDTIMQGIDWAADNAIDTDDAMENLDDLDDVKDLIVGLDSMKDDEVNINAARADRMSTLDRELLDQSVKGRTIKDILDENKDTTKPQELPKTELKVASPNEEWKDMSYINFDKSYDLEKDIANAFRHFSTVSRPLSIRNIKAEDNSTSEDRLDLYTVDYEDYRGKRYTVKLDIPKIKNNRFLLRGDAQMIQAQFFNMPIIKTDEDVCQIVSNYKKIIISRFNTTSGKSLPNTSRFIKAASKYAGKKIKFTEGNNTLVCSKYVLPIDYIDLSSVYSKIETDEVIVYLNQDEIHNLYEVNDSLGVPYALNKKDNTIIYYSNKETTPFIDILVGTIITDVKKYQDFFDLYTAIKAPSRGMYTRAKIMGSEIPLIVVCGYYEGLSKILNKANIQYQLVDKLTSDIRTDMTKDWVRFDDGYLVYTVTYDSSLLLNGLKDCDTISHSITEVDDRNMWLDYLDAYGGRIKSDGLDNFYDCEIDPITKETLAYYKLPTEYVSCLLYANYLLSDNKFIKHTDTSSRRIRRFELIAAYTYQVLAEAYGTYSNSLKHNRNGASFGCKQSAVIDKIMMDPTSSNYSVANVLNDVESSNAITTKGLSGLNADRSYSLDKRTYDDSMLGVVGMSTGFSGNVGITRQATLNSNIEGSRGYVKDNKGKMDSANTANTLTATESLVPFSTTHDDPFRTAMTFIQTSKHSLRTEESDPLLVTNGADEALPYICSDQFAYKAKAKGIVKEITEDYMIVQYENGTKDYINLKETIEKNSDGGFYVPLKLDVADKLKVGSKISENQILAYDKSSMSNSVGESDDIAYDIGKLAKVAIINTDDGYEDAGIITENMAEKLSAKIVYKETCTLDKNTNIYNVAKVGSHLEEGDSMLVWQTPYDEEEVNNLLKALANDKDTLSELGKHTVKSEATGTLIGIKAYRTVELEELSDSLQKFFKEYEKPIKDLRKKLKEEGIEDTDIPADYALPATGKLKGAGDGVLIEFYAEVLDRLGIGDKVTYNAANKAVITNIIPKGKMPYTDSNSEEEVSALVSTTSIAKRMVSSTVIYGSLQKLMVELDRSCKDILGIPRDHSKI